MAIDFKVHRADALKKINAERMALSQPTIYKVPILTKPSVCFSPASDRNNQPATCYNCALYNYGKSCQLIGPHVKVRKFTYPKEYDPKHMSKPIEYWPMCAKHTFGEPNHADEQFIAASDPTAINLLWINADEPGRPIGGANCGGPDGGDDCDYFKTIGDDMHSNAPGFCRVLQTKVGGGDWCGAWDDDDKVFWGEAQDLIQELEGDPENDRLMKAALRAEGMDVPEDGRR